DWGAQQERARTCLHRLQDEWGRVGFESENRSPNVFVGFHYDGADHCVELTRPQEGPDFCLVLSFAAEIPHVANYPEHPSYRALVERLEKSPPPLRFEFHNQREQNQRHGKRHNSWHPLLLRRNAKSL